ncbi:Protein kinase [Sorangium cellulosum So ce56]|uniref:Protein kinase n=1 Tax=Sorangium cellulosum (strain So ce56) TaxID=448385 RepID=A9GHT8_SORC5|nr:serine/threonine-protein kinase [Sorangium cellulosum]CAN90158.1 Protein kinase [Sorangium cellulosum So ce56]
MLSETFGRYRLLERLGEGGMAEVFKAKSFGVEGFEKVLVIKRILPKLAEQGRFVDMFVHEAKLAVRLSHANIVQVFDLGRVDHPNGDPTSYFIAMEYVPGLDLATLLARCRRAKKPIPLAMAVFMTAEIAKALDHAHRRRDEQSRPLGIVHRDISPQNILLSWEGEVKVTDFGIAKATQSMTDEEVGENRAGRIRGKLAYMSPEQSRAGAIDGRSDLFSLGTVLYEMLAGSNPFAAPTAFEIMRRLQASEYPPLALVRPDVPRSLADVVSTMLAKNPEDRFPDAGRLHEALLGFFYATAERFGANDLADFLEPFHEEKSAEIQASAVLQEEPNGANERTPVEVPHTTSTRSRSASGLLQLLEKADSGPAARGLGERREVTALVLIFTGSEDDAARRMARARDVLARYGALLLEQEASQLVAVFGLGDADGRDTEAAVRAALVILRSRGGGAAVSAGIHLARILVDSAGAPIRDERLTSLIASAQALARATESQVAVSNLTGRVLRNAFATEELPGAGRTAPEGGRVVTSAQPPDGAYGRFIGRRDELKQLGDILAAATRKRAQIVVIQGERGIGKTRLLAEMERRLSKGDYNVGVYVAACPHNGADVPWSGLTAMLQVLCGIQEGDDEERIRAVLPRLRALGLRDDESAAVLGQLGAALAERRAPQGTTAILRTAFPRMVQSLCEDRLHCFAWDDAQAMDQLTAETLLATAGRAGGLRAVLMLATRCDPPPLLEAHPHFYRLKVGELSDSDSARLMSARIGASFLPPDVVAFCRERAGGHPLFLEELIKELLDSGALSVVSGVVKARLDGASAVPRSLRTLIATRVRRLDPSDRAVLQAAAILGDPVPTEVLAALLQQKLPAVNRAISGLATRDLLRLKGPAQASFASPMHGEIVLDAIPPELRRELHAAAAAAYVAVVGEDGTEHAERIGQHFYQAGDRDRAATFYARAALHKIRASQLDPALRLIFQALDLGDHAHRSPAELAAWLGALADVVVRVRSAPDLVDVAARALRRIDEAGAPEQKLSARVDLARALGAVDLFADAYARLEEAYALAGDREDLRRKALASETEIGVRSGDFARAERAVEQLEATGAIDDPRLLLAISQTRAATGDIAAALRALDRAEALGDPGDLAAASEREKQRVLVHVFLRDFDAAVKSSARAVDLARSAGLRFETAAALHNLGDASRRLGDLPRAYASLTESKELAEESGHERLASINRAHLAYLDGLSGAAGAGELLRELARYADARSYRTDALESRYLLGALLKQRGLVKEARRELAEVLDLASAYGNKLVADDARSALSEL